MYDDAAAVIKSYSLTLHYVHRNRNIVRKCLFRFIVCIWNDMKEKLDIILFNFAFELTLNFLCLIREMAKYAIFLSKQFLSYFIEAPHITIFKQIHLYECPRFD